MIRSRFLLALLLLTAGACKDSPVAPTPAAKDYRVGELHRFNVNSQSSCDSPDYRTGRVMAVTQRAIVVADTANPRGAGTFSDAEYQGFATTFDDLVWPTVTENFGTPQDVDRNGKVIIFFTRAVNELTPRGQNWFVGGYFFSRDLFPTRDEAGFKACAGSNYAEMFYMLVPDPSGTVNGNSRSKDRELRATVAVLAHEFQHLINASRRLYVVRAGGNDWNEISWLNEGLSHIAEELLGYRTSSLAPRQNIDAQRLSTSPTEQSAFFEYQAQNFSRLAAYLQNPEGQSLIGPDSLATRGATWQFLRYAADRKGGSEAALWRSLVDSGVSGIANLRSALGAEPMEWIQDWAVSIYTDDTAPGVESRFQQQSWNFRSIYPRLRNSGGQTVYASYPLKTTVLENRSRSVEIAAGSAAFLRFGVPAAGRAEIRLEAGAASCLTSGPALSLSVGAVHTVTADQAGTLCLDGGAAGAEFTYIPFFASETASGRRVIEITAAGVIPVLGPPSPALIPSRDAALLAAGDVKHEHGARPDAGWEMRLREREARELAPRVRGGIDQHVEILPRGTSFSIADVTDPLRLRISIVRTK
ncbi:MAG: hypothetical protein H0X65_06620 [Gemmatimonadetes bacterium]|nr:hypothetical protein [Gemmatimonadota bacterium]